MPDDVYERILERIKGKDVRIVVDATKKTFTQRTQVQAVPHQAEQTGTFRNVRS